MKKRQWGYWIRIWFKDTDLDPGNPAHWDILINNLRVMRDLMVGLAFKTPPGGRPRTRKSHAQLLADCNRVRNNHSGKKRNQLVNIFAEEIGYEGKVSTLERQVYDALFKECQVYNALFKGLPPSGREN